MTMRIGVSGAEGSFSEQAGLHYVRQEKLSDAELECLVSVENVLTGLENGSIERGIFPIENSNGGVVIEAVYAMARHRFTVEKLFEIDVHHNLLATAGTTKSDITTITSHDQALKQCRMYLKRTFPGVDLVEYADTAQAAKDLGKGAHMAEHCTLGPTCIFCAEEKRVGTEAVGTALCTPKGILPKTTAVIAPKACAELYGLAVLEESIQDLKFNFTTFVVAARYQEV